MSQGAIVTGTDGSQSATAALRQAAELAAASRVVLHVVSAPTRPLIPSVTRAALELVRTLERLGDSGRRGAFLNTVLDGIGHMPHLSQPAHVGERLAAWAAASGMGEARDAAVAR